MKKAHKFEDGQLAILGISVCARHVVGDEDDLCFLTPSGQKLFVEAQDELLTPSADQRKEYLRRKDPQ